MRHRIDRRVLAQRDEPAQRTQRSKNQALSRHLRRKANPASSNGTTPTYIVSTRSHGPQNSAAPRPNNNGEKSEPVPPAANCSRRPFIRQPRPQRITRHLQRRQQLRRRQTESDQRRQQRQADHAPPSTWRNDDLPHSHRYQSDQRDRRHLRMPRQQRNRKRRARSDNPSPDVRSGRAHTMPELTAATPPPQSNSNSRVHDQHIIKHERNRTEQRRHRPISPLPSMSA